MPKRINTSRDEDLEAKKRKIEYDTTHLPSLFTSSLLDTSYLTSSPKIINFRVVYQNKN